MQQPEEDVGDILQDRMDIMRQQPPNADTVGDMDQEVLELVGQLPPELIELVEYGVLDPLKALEFMGMAGPEQADEDRNELDAVEAVTGARDTRDGGLADG